MLKIPHADFLGLFQAIFAQFTLKMCVAAKNCEKITKNYYFGGTRSNILMSTKNDIWNFLLVINSNLGPISHRF